jgi:nitronate monooxygenase
MMSEPNLAIASPLCRRLGIAHPLLLAPMANVAGGRLAAAVSQAGGLGLIGGGYGDPEWLGAELAAAEDAAIGVGFINWRLDQLPQVLDMALAARPRAVLLSFGDIAPYSARIHAAGASLIAQVQSVAQARAARDAGADVVVAQGSDAGGHAGMRGTLALVPAVVDAVSPLPVVAAGGIGDARGIAAAFMLGACGVMLGSRFYGSREALASSAAKQTLLAASGDDTVRGAVFDKLRGWHWPAGYSLRTLANDMTARWPDEAHGLSSELAEQRAAFERALAAGDTRIAPVIVGEAADLIVDLPPAAELVTRLMAEAETLLAQAGRWLTS